MRGEKYHLIQWAPFTSNATEVATTWPTIGSVGVLQGKLDRVFIKKPSIAGSIYIIESGTEVSLFSASLSSGVSVDAYPRVFAVNNINTSLSGTNAGIYAQYTVANPLYLTGSRFTSGTSNFVSGIFMYLER